jgi:hypothetical protein
MHRMSDAIEEAARMTRGDQWEYATIILTNGIDPPRIILCDGKRGKAFDAATVKTRGRSFGFAFLQAASLGLRDFTSGFLRHEAPYENVPKMHAQRREWELRRVLKEGAHELAHPHACICGSRFATARGLAIHVRTKRYGTHAPRGDGNQLDLAS